MLPAERAGPLRQWAKASKSKQLNRSKSTMFSMRGRWCPGGGMGVAENQGAVTRKGGRLFCYQRGKSYSKCRTANLFRVCYA